MQILIKNIVTFNSTTFASRQNCCLWRILLFVPGILLNFKDFAIDHFILKRHKNSMEESSFEPQLEWEIGLQISINAFFWRSVNHFSLV